MTGATRPESPTEGSTAKAHPLLTGLSTGDGSWTMVEAYRLHPNAIKAFARCGQGYLLADDEWHPVAYGMLPPLRAEYPLPRKDQQETKYLDALNKGERIALDGDTLLVYSQGLEKPLRFSRDKK
jgi:hypothetical protein